MLICTNCGKEVSEDMKFCPKCGNRLTKTQGEQTATSALYKEVSAKDEDLLPQNIASDTSSEAQEETKAAKLETLWAEMKSDLRSWGFGLAGIGIISIVFSGFLDPVWGGILIVLGVLCFLIKRRGMYIAIGTGLMLAGIMNIFSGEFGGWTIFGVFQIGFGIYEVRKFWKYASVSVFWKQ